MLPPFWRPCADFARALGLVVIVFQFVVVLLVAGRVSPARADTAGDANVSSSHDIDAGGPADAGPVLEVTVQGRAASPLAASEVKVGPAELALQPRLRAEQVLEEVPGLFTVQHSGGAKAQQYFLRGFDADHGTDIAFFADGVPPQCGEPCARPGVH